MVHARWLVVLLLLGIHAEASAGEIEIVDAPPREEPAGPDWVGSYEAALADPAKRPLFLFFTAGWCGYCHQMEDETLSDPKVRRVLEGYACAKIDIDADANREVCRRYQPEGGIPSYVLVDLESGGGLELPGGFRPAEEFLRSLPAPAELEVPQDLEAAGSGEQSESVLADSVETLLGRSDWSAATEVADAYLERFPSAERADEVRRLRAVARYHVDGVLDPLLKTRIRDRLTVFEEPLPEETLLDRAKRLLGTRPEAAEGAQQAWVRRQNAALAELAGYGEAAVDLLLVAVRTAPTRTSERAATALGWIGSPRSRPVLRRWALDEALSVSVRSHAVQALGGMRDVEAMPVLVRLLSQGEEAASLRLSAASAIGLVGMREDASPNAAVGDALLAAAVGDDPRLRHECLHSLLTVEAPYDLAPLAELLLDHREGWTGHRNSQYAAWALLRVKGKTVQRDGKDVEITPEVAEHLATWLESNR